MNTEEVKECKKRKELETQNEHFLQENRELQDKICEQERYRMRWCLRISRHRRKKRRKHQIDSHPKKLCKIAPDVETKLEDAVDIVHRKKDGQQEQKCHSFACSKADEGGNLAKK